MSRILVVDDEDMILDMLRTLLGKGGHEVFTAQDAAAALAILETEKPEVAIVDLVMPGKGGLTLIMENLAAAKNLAVIAMSGRIPVSTDSMLGFGATFRVSCFLPKPFTQTELDAAIATALASSRA